jgi:hypothetical protein
VIVVVKKRYDLIRPIFWDVEDHESPEGGFSSKLYISLRRNFRPSMKNKPLVIIILASLLACYFSYYFVQRQVIVKTRNVYETEYHTEIYNPISKIFLGRVSRGETSYRQYDVIDRVTTLIETATIVCLLLAVVQYARSRGQKYEFLLFMMVTEMYVLVGGISTRLFRWIYNLTYPESELFPPSTVSLWWLQSALLLSALSILIMLLISPGKTDATERRPLRVPIKWMRPFHYITDRLLILLLVSNRFVLYFLNGSEIELGRNELYWWALLSVTGCFIIATFVTESLFQISPSKIITGSLVVSRDLTKPSTGSIVARSLARLIPFNSISFLGKTGWHDSISNTTVVYAAEGSWLARQSKLVTVVFLSGIIVMAALLVTNVMMTIDPFNFSNGFALPIALAPMTLLMMMLVLTCWLASLSNFSENLYNGDASESGSHFWTALALWVPLLNFRINSVLLNDISHNLVTSLANEEQKQNLELRTSQVRKSFIILNIAIILAALLWLKVSYRIEFMIVIIMLTSALMYWSFNVIRYTKFIRSISEEVTEAYVSKTDLNAVL